MTPEREGRSGCWRRHSSFPRSDRKREEDQTSLPRRLPSRHDRGSPSAGRAHMSMRAALALLLALVSAPLAAGEAAFPGKTWEMPGPDPPAGWSAERLRIAEARFHATR